MKKNLLYSLVAAGTLLIGGTVISVAETTNEPDAAPQLFPYISASPQNGSTMKSLNSVTLVLPVWNMGENMPYFDPDKISDIQILKGTTPVASATEVLPSEGSGSSLPYTITFPALTESGEYTLTIPEGFFYEAAWDETAEGFKKVDGARISGKITLDYTIDANMKAPIEDYVLIPADGETVSKLDEIIFAFPKLSMGEITKYDDKTITLTNVADPTKTATVTYDVYLFTPEYMGNGIQINVDPAVKEDGEWRLEIPEGIVVEDATGAKSPAVSATFKVVASAAAELTYECNPADGSTVGDDRVSSTNGLSVNFYFNDYNELVQGEDPFDEISVKFDGTPLPKIGKGQIAEKEGWAWRDNFGDPQATFLISPKTLTKSGKIEITIPAGAILLDDIENQEINYTLNFTSSASETHEYTWTANPGNNSKIDTPVSSETVKFSRFTFTIPEAEEVSYDEWEDPNYDSTVGSQTRVMQVTYNGESVPRVTDANSTEGYQLRDNYGSNDIVVAINNQVFAKGGMLEITIDEGYCTADGNYPTPGIRYTCQVGEIKVAKDYEVTVSPKMNIDEQYLIDYFRDGFKIEFTNAQTVVTNMVKDYDDNDQPIMVMAKPPHLAIGNVIYYGDVKVDEVKDAACPTFIVTFPDMFDYDTTLGGSINLSIDEGTFTVDGEFDSPAISQTWTLKRTKEVVTDYIFGPAGDIVNQGYGIYATISFDGDESISLNRSNVVVKFNDEVLPESEYNLSVINDDNRCIYFELMNDRFMDNTLTGTLSVSIPDQAVSVSGVKIGAIEHTWNIVLPKDFNYTVKGFASKYLAGPTYDYKNPAQTTELPECGDLSEIIFEIPNAKTAKLWNANYINLRSRDYFSYGAHAPEVEEVIGAEHPTFKFKFAEAPEAETIYELSFNYGAFYVDNAYETPNLEFAVVFKKGSGVAEIIGSTAEGFTVVTVDGKVVFTNGTLDQVKALDKGIYIINGKKVAVR